MKNLLLLGCSTEWVFMNILSETTIGSEKDPLYDRYSKTRDEEARSMVARRIIQESFHKTLLPTLFQELAEPHYQRPEMLLLAGIGHVPDLPNRHRFSDSMSADGRSNTPPWYTPCSGYDVQASLIGGSLAAMVLIAAALDLGSPLTNLTHPHSWSTQRALNMNEVCNQTKAKDHSGDGIPIIDSKTGRRPRDAYFQIHGVHPK